MVFVRPATTNGGQSKPTPRESCISRGGTWNSETNKCEFTSETSDAERKAEKERESRKKLKENLQKDAREREAKKIEKKQARDEERRAQEVRFNRGKTLRVSGIDRDLTPEEYQQFKEQARGVSSRGDINELLQERLRLDAIRAKEKQFGVEAGGLGTTGEIPTEGIDQFAQQVGVQEGEIDQSQIEQQFEAEGGFQELEGRGERIIERAAEVGLKPAEMIVKGIEKATGLKPKFTTEELVETNLGKALGVATIAAAAPVIYGSAAATAIGGFVTSAGAGIASSLGVSQGAILAGGALLAGINKDSIVNSILGRANAEKLQTAIGRQGTVASAVVGNFKANPQLGAPKAIAELNRLEDNLNILESEIQQAAMLDRRVVTSGKYFDILAEIDDQRTTIVEGKREVLSASQQFNPLEIERVMSDLEAATGVKRNQLVKKGFIKETL